MMRMELCGFKLSESIYEIRHVRKLERPVVQLRGFSGKSVRVMTPIYRGIFRGLLLCYFDLRLFSAEPQAIQIFWRVGFY